MLSENIAQEQSINNLVDELFLRGGVTGRGARSEVLVDLQYVAREVRLQVRGAVWLRTRSSGGHVLEECTVQLDDPGSGIGTATARDFRHPL